MLWDGRIGKPSYIYIILLGCCEGYRYSSFQPHAHDGELLRLGVLLGE